MRRFSSLTRWHVLGMIGIFALGMVAVTFIVGVLVSNQASAHGGDASLVHACVNQTNAQVRIAHPGPGNEDTDCTALGADWMNVHLDDDWSGAGTGSLFNLTDNVGIGTATPNEQLEITGNFRLPTTTANAGIIMSDGNPFVHSFGADNFFAGVAAGNLAMTGGFNTGVGASALQANTTGCCNAALGDGSLSLNTTGGFNTAIGSGALRDNTTGGANTAQGTNALGSNTTGFSNTASGSNALTSNTTGAKNTATGGSSLIFNTTGDNNTATGRDALQSNTIGNRNTATGFEALLSNSTGDNNTATGEQALRSNTTGFSNVATGEQALQSNTTGFSNVATGRNALQDNTTGFSNVAIGRSGLVRNTVGFENTATGALALQQNTTGTANTAIGVNALFLNTTGNNNTAIGHTATVTRANLTNATAIGANAFVDASNKIRLGDNDVTVVETAGAFSSLSGEFIAGGTTLNVPDYVFEKDYPLLSLDDLRAYVAREKHLPNVPSLQDIRADGLNLSEFQMTLLEKVEELTLYILAQQREIEALKEAVATLKGSTIIAEQ